MPSVGSTRPLERRGYAVAVISSSADFRSDSRRLLTTAEDGALRLYALDADGERFVLGTEWSLRWTPEGYYDASPGAEELIGYHLNHGREHAGEFVSAAQLRETFYQPGLIARRLDADGEQRLAELVARRGDVRQILAAGPRPELELLSKAEDDSDGEYRLKLRVRQLGQGSGRLLLRIDDQEVAGRWQAPALTPGGVIEFPLDPLAPGLRRLSLELVDARGVASPPLRVDLKVRAAASAPPPRLHVLAVGVTRYSDHSLAKGVAFAAADAHAVAQALARGGQGIYAPGKVRVLADGQAASKQAILDAGREIAAGAGPASGPEERCREALLRADGLAGVALAGGTDATGDGRRSGAVGRRLRPVPQRDPGGARRYLAPVGDADRSAAARRRTGARAGSARGR